MIGLDPTQDPGDRIGVFGRQTSEFHETGIVGLEAA